MTRARARQLRARVLYQPNPQAQVRSLRVAVLYRPTPVQGRGGGSASATAQAVPEISTKTFGRSSASATSRARASASTWSLPDIPPNLSGHGVVRWLLIERRTGDYWQMYINPNDMTAPPMLKNLSRVAANRAVDGRVMSFQTPSPAAAWEWSGVILTKQHHDKLLEWANKGGVVRVRDHLGRVFEVLMENFVPDEPAGRRPDNWKMKYTMTVQLLRRIR